jgi:hypothetical protein
VNQEQALAHARMLRTLTVRTVLKNEEPGQVPWNAGLKGYKHRSESGRKGREKAGIRIPEFRTLKQRKR